MVAHQIAQGPWKAYQKSTADVQSAEQLLFQARLWHGAILEARSGEEALWRKARERGPGFDLFSFLHGLVRDMDLENRYNIQSLRRTGMSSQLAGVDMTLEGISLEELVDFLHAVDSSNNLVVLSNLRKLGTSADGVGLDCGMSFLPPKAR
jgi:hypothetical protein